MGTTDKKQLALASAVLATILLILNIIQMVKMSQAGKGILPASSARTLFTSYFLLFGIAYLLSGSVKKVKHRLDAIINILLIINVFALIGMTVVFILVMLTNM